MHSRLRRAVGPWAQRRTLTDDSRAQAERLQLHIASILVIGLTQRSTQTRQNGVNYPMISLWQINRPMLFMRSSSQRPMS